jgi:SAM-dependent methyltransferase
MLRIVDGKQYGEAPSNHAVEQGGGLIGALSARFTRRLHARQVLSYLSAAERHLDIGCGDGYLLRRSPCHDCIGLDQRMGDELVDHLPFDDEHVDFVTVLSDLEYLPDPAAIIRECDRVLKSSGRLIIRTPGRLSEPLIHLYAHYVQGHHETLFTASEISNLCPPSLVLVDAHPYLLGFGQLLCFQKMLHDAAESLVRSLSMSAN